tara:strand:- start:51 stop:230 length:180 start_codon:yes stop_codon:yes gene_type:complete
MPSKCFVKITNGDIYEKLVEIERHVIETNGKVKLNRWIASSALAFVTALGALLLSIKLW